MRKQDVRSEDDEAEGITLVTGSAPEVTLEERLRGDQQARISARATPEGEALVDVTEPPRRRERAPQDMLAATSKEAEADESSDDIDAEEPFDAER